MNGAPPYLRTDRLEPGTTLRPRTAFFLRPSDYRVTDGDTISVLAPRGEDGKRQQIFAVRVPNVNAPEKVYKREDDAFLSEAGYAMNSGHPGSRATEAAKKCLAGRALYIEPVTDKDGLNTDRHGRLIGGLTVSGSVGRDFDCTNAFDFERHMVREGHANIMRGKELPNGVPLLIDRLARMILEDRRVNTFRVGNADRSEGAGRAPEEDDPVVF